ncbi:Pectate lyase superfamily protein [uncultured Caudovirales phage]|uniref:Pectate lyase superfamily protein n=1 Tax=uncultured Caudovirales phage TaxID=2100421 RepID=A0A6J5L353_9CAUD|nr:Pectate lyase superfamily protein [uncultured Caudovirales phage]
MTAITQIPDQVRRQRYVASAGQTSFPTGWPIYDAGDVGVYRIRGGFPGKLGLTIDYTVTGTGTEAGATVVLTSGATAGDVLVLVSEQPIERSTAFADNGPLRAAALERELNRIIIEELQLRDQVGRSLRGPPLDPLMVELPSATLRAGRLLGFDTNGDPALLPQNVVASTTPPASGLNWVHVDSFGAAGNGTTDDTAAFQAAHDQLAATGGIIWCSPKPYRIAGTINITASVIIQGQGFQEVTADRGTGGVGRPPRGTWFIHDKTSGPVLYVTGASAAGFELRDLAFFEPGHPTPGTGWAPTVYDYCVRLENVGADYRLTNVHFHNVYRGLFSDYAGRPILDRITGQCFDRGICIRHCYDIGTLGMTRWWPYWSEHAAVLAYTQANAVALYLQSPDACMMQAVFVFGCKTAIYCPADDGLGHSLWVGQLYADFTGTALLCEAPNINGHVGILFHLGQQWGTSTALAGACALKASGGTNWWQVSQVISNLSWQSAIYNTGTGNLMQLASVVVGGWNKAADGSPAIEGGTNAGNFINYGTPPFTYSGGGAPSYSAGAGENGQHYLPATVNYTDTAGQKANWPQLYASRSGQPVLLTPSGSDASIGLYLATKGNGSITLAPAGTGKINIGGASAGSAGALYGYVSVQVNGVDCKIPFYAP